jgi:hypothetical protein
LGQLTPCSTISANYKFHLTFIVIFDATKTMPFDVTF